MAGEYTKGRPDFKDHRFGITVIKKFPPFVYSLLGGMLVHRVLLVEANWYEPAKAGACLKRREAPALNIVTVCGQVFCAGPGKRANRSMMCVRPRLEAVLCGRCNGTGAVFGPGLAEKGIRRKDARQWIGCAIELP